MRSRRYEKLNLKLRKELRSGDEELVRADTHQSVVVVVVVVVLPFAPFCALALPADLAAVVPLGLSGSVSGWRGFAR